MLLNTASFKVQYRSWMIWIQKCGTNPMTEMSLLWTWSSTSFRIADSWNQFKAVFPRPTATSDRIDTIWKGQWGAHICSRVSCIQGRRKPWCSRWSWCDSLIVCTDHKLIEQDRSRCLQRTPSHSSHSKIPIPALANTWWNYNNVRWSHLSWTRRFWRVSITVPNQSWHH